MGTTALALGVAAVGLWIGARSLSVALAKQSIEVAAVLDGGNANVMGERSSLLLEAGNMRAATSLAVGALRRDPTVISAVQALGLAAQARGDASRAGRLLSYSQRLSRRDLQTHLWAIEYYVARGDTRRVLDEYDLALRTSLQSRDILFPVLGSAMADPVVARELVAHLKGRPLWYDAFLSFVGRDNRVAPVTVVSLFNATRAAGITVPPADLAVLIGRSLDTGDAETAWKAYALKRPGVNRRRLRDPEFRSLPEDASPLDWTLFNDGSIQSRAIEQNGSGQLQVEAGSGSAGLAVQQMQMLPRGRFRLVVDGGGISQGASLAWSLSCRDGAELTKLMLSGEPGRRFAGPVFDVPSACKVQTLKLIADAGESAEGLHATISRVILVPAS